MRIGLDGPDGPRPSDYDPQPPVPVPAQRRREQGAVGDDDEPARIDLDEDTQRLAGFIRKEEQRYRARLANQDSDDPPESL